MILLPVVSLIIAEMRLEPSMRRLLGFSSVTKREPTTMSTPVSSIFETRLSI